MSNETQATTPEAVQQSQSSPPPEGSLYKARKKIHPRAVTGVFANWRWALVWFTQILFYGLCWLPWNGRQAVLLNLVERKFYLFGLVLWPQDVIWLTVLLIISAYGLFLFTAIAGRLWCGYACPQTVYTEIFVWIEKLVEGDRNARIKLDAAPMNGAKMTKRAIKYGLWALLSAWTGFTLVGYFTPIKSLAAEFATLSLGPWEWFWFLFYGAFTFLMAGLMREQVCLYMCPYARFQGVMFDPDTLVITYDAERGEPRAPRKKGEDYKAEGKGDCVDCDLCVAVCPTGIDIRKGLQYECIGCAACIDVCDQVMEKMGYPKGLVRYSTEHAIAEHWGWQEIMGHIARPRVVLYSVILAVITAVLVWGLATKASLRVDVIRDRGTLAREVDDGLIENVFRLQVMNVTEEPHRYSVAVSGLNKIQLADGQSIEVPAASTKSFVVHVRAPQEPGKTGSNPIYFDIKADDNDKVSVHEKAIFLFP